MDVQITHRIIKFTDSNQGFKWKCSKLAFAPIVCIKGGTSNINGNTKVDIFSKTKKTYCRHVSIEFDEFFKILNASVYW